MEIRIGLADTARELTFDSDEAADAVKQTVTTALADGAAFVSFADTKGSSYIVPTTRIAFVEVGTEESRRVGFVA